MAEVDFTQVVEEWRPVVGYKGHYSVSSLGRVRSEAKGKGFRRSSLIMTAVINPNGRERLTLCKNGVKTFHSVHKLVAEAFLGPKPNGLVTNHRDGNKLNNRLSNLEYVTSAENEQHAVRLGLKASGLRSGRYTKPQSTVKGSRHWKAKLNEQDVREIKRLIAEDNLTVRQLAKQFAVDYTTIAKIKHGKAWTHVN